MDLTLVAAPDMNSFDAWLGDAKAYLGRDGDAHDPMIAGLIRTAVARLDGPRGRLGRALATQTWRLRLNEHEHEVALPLPPLQAVDAVTYVDGAGETRTVAIGDYVVEGTDPGFVRPRPRWPSTNWAEAGIVVTFTAGYGEANDVPDILKTAILDYVAALYDNRGGLQALPPVASDLVDSYRSRAF